MGPPVGDRSEVVRRVPADRRDRRTRGHRPHPAAVPARPQRLTMRRPTLGCALAAALVVGGCGGGGAPQPPVVPGRVLHVYTSLPFQGDLAGRARDTYDAERLALAETGARAGRYRVRLLPLDASTLDAGRWDPNQVIANARRATQDPRTIAYIGELDTGASAVSIPVLDQKGILQVSPADGLAGLTRREGATRGEPEKYYTDPRR